jgi:hypothetical protein
LQPSSRGGGAGGDVGGGACGDICHVRGSGCSGPRGSPNSTGAGENGGHLALRRLDLAPSPTGDPTPESGVPYQSLRFDSKLGHFSLDPKSESYYVYVEIES